MYLKRYLSKKKVPHYIERGLAVNAAQVPSPQENINLATILDSLATTSPKFKFPTIMSGYQHGINPVSALYENVQEILLKNSNNHEISRWVLSLFDNKEWKRDLLTAISEDRDTLINIFLESPISGEEKEILQYNIEKFRHYHIVFSTI